MRQAIASSRALRHNEDQLPDHFYAPVFCYHLGDGVLGCRHRMELFQARSHDAVPERIPVWVINSGDVRALPTQGVRLRVRK